MVGKVRACIRNGRADSGPAFCSSDLRSTFFLHGQSFSLAVCLRITPRVSSIRPDLGCLGGSWPQAHQSRRLPVAPIYFSDCTVLLHPAGWSVSCISFQLIRWALFSRPIHHPACHVNLAFSKSRIAAVMVYFWWCSVCTQNTGREATQKPLERMHGELFTSEMWVVRLLLGIWAEQNQGTWGIWSLRDPLQLCDVLSLIQNEKEKGQAEWVEICSCLLGRTEIQYHVCEKNVLRS